MIPEDEQRLFALVRERVGDEPSVEQAQQHEVIKLDGDRTALCCWYPTMGGYVSRALVIATRDEPCVEVIVWHNGDFPFCGRDAWEWDGQARNPARLHHCSADSFIGFGQMVAEFQEALQQPVVMEP